MIHKNKNHKTTTKLFEKLIMSTFNIKSENNKTPQYTQWYKTNGMVWNVCQRPRTYGQMLLCEK